MKNIICLIALSLTPLLANATSYVVGGFGTDGASNESMPSEDSTFMAALIWKALDVETGEFGSKTVAAGESLFQCDKPEKGIHTFTAACGFEGLGSIVSNDPLTVRLGSELSEALFHALPESSETVRVGATSREVANLNCARKIASRKLIYSCTVKGVNAISANF